MATRTAIHHHHLDRIDRPSVPDGRWGRAFIQAFDRVSAEHDLGDGIYRMGYSDRVMWATAYANDYVKAIEFNRVPPSLHQWRYAN